MNTKHRISRKAFIAGTGATLVLASGGMLWRAEGGIFTAEEGPAYELWKQPWPEKPAANDLMGIVGAATLAANPHNSQPWLFRIEKDKLDLFADRSRKLQAIDPDERELMLGLGCALENLALAAEARGYRPDITLFPQGPEDDLVAGVLLQKAEPKPSPLYEMIPKRRTNRSKFSGKPIPDKDLADLSELSQADPGLRLHLYVKEGERKPIGDLLIRACEIQAKDAAQHGETASWFRKSDEEIQKHRDGITLDAGGSPYLMRVIAKLVISDKMIQGPSFGEVFVKNTKMQVESASAFGMISAETKTHETCLRAGRLFQKIHLWATSRGIALHPMNYFLENRSEMEEEAAALTGSSGRAALIPFRLGYGREVPHSPRRAVKDVIKS
ncbi:MAG: hypothetical protein HY801_13265 [Candidatus Lindowbacteria bacterium]|nr:hypothetical protein [Candidatus Lindowbacteria bacterium]